MMMVVGEKRQKSSDMTYIQHNVGIYYEIMLEDLMTILILHQIHLDHIHLYLLYHY